MHQSKGKKGSQNRGLKKDVRTFFWKKNLIAAICLFIVYSLMKQNPGHKWIMSMVKSNLETISKHSDMSIDKRYEYKVKADKKYLDYVKKETPDTAVILFPKSADQGGLQNFSHSFSNDTWKSYFLYPRKLVSADSKYYDSLKKAGAFTHLAIVNKKGYELLGSPVDIAKAREYYVISLNK